MSFSLSEFIVGGDDRQNVEKYRGDMQKIGGAVTLDDTITNTIVPDVVGECAFGLVRESGEPCASASAVAKMSVIAGRQADVSEIESNAELRKSILAEAKIATKCESERCVIQSKEFTKLAGKSEASRELADKFKIGGPTDTALLNDKNIDATMKQWETRFNDPAEIEKMQKKIRESLSAGQTYNIQKIDKFYAFNFNMRNFEEVGDTLATVDIRDLYNRGYRVFGCVVNTDLYSGPGIHWMALFGDMRDVGDNTHNNIRSNTHNNSAESSDEKPKWTVEFYNSSGNAPQKEFAKWLMKTRDRMQDIINENRGKPGIPDTAESVVVIKKPHQFSRTECGVYALYYIWARINGIPYTYFRDNDIPDILCFELRQHLFHDPRRNPMKYFDYNQFHESSQIKWEHDAPKSKIQKYIQGSLEKLGNISRESAVITGSAEDRATQSPVNTEQSSTEYKNLPDIAHVDGSRGEFVAMIGILSKYYSIVLSCDHIVCVNLARDTSNAKKIISMIKLLRIQANKLIVFRDLAEVNARTAEFISKKIIFIVCADTDQQKNTIDPKLRAVFDKQAELIARIKPELSIVNFSPEIYARDSGNDAHPRYTCGEMCYVPWACGKYIKLVIWKDNADRICEYADYSRVARNRFWDSHQDKHGLCATVPGYDACGDCYSEEQSAIQYIKNVARKVPSAGNIAQTIAIFTALFSSRVGGLLAPPHGIYKKCGQNEKLRKIAENYPQLIGGFESVIGGYFAGDSSDISCNPRTNIYLVRHAQTDFNANKIIQGTIISPPINPIGAKQAEKTGDNLANVHFDRAYTSPMLRCVQTAQIIIDRGNFTEKTPIIYKQLEDLCMGNLEGMYYADAEALILQKYGIALADIRRMPDQKQKRVLEHMEAYEDYYTRLVSAIQEIARENIGGTILICTHARLSLFRDFIEGNYYSAEPVDNASYSHILYCGDSSQVYNPEKYQVVEWNTSSGIS